LKNRDLVGVGDGGVAADVPDVHAAVGKHDAGRMSALDGAIVAASARAQHIAGDDSRCVQQTVNLDHRHACLGVRNGTAPSRQL
jgi:hypothetical protein